MNHTKSINNGVHGTGTSRGRASQSRFPTGKQRGPVRLSVAARVKWTKVNTTKFCECEAQFLISYNRVTVMGSAASGNKAIIFDEGH